MLTHIVISFDKHGSSKAFDVLFWKVMHKRNYVGLADLVVYFTGLTFI